MRNGILIGLVVAAVGALGFACSSTASSPAFPDVSSFCTAKAKAECQVNASCAIDQTSCQAYRNQLCMQDAAQATASSTRKYSSDNAQSCIDALNGAYGNSAAKITYDQLAGPGSIADKCERVFAGAAAVNAACNSDYDCAGSAICAPVAPGSANKVCANQVDPQGSFCATPGTKCPTDQYCAASTTGAPTCTAAAGNGMACSAAVPCVGTQRCSNGVCEPRATIGQACSTSDDCAADAHYCDPYGGNICTIGLTFATGAADCKGYLPPTTTGGNDAGTQTDSGGGTVDSGGGGSDSGTAADASGDATGD